MAVWISSIAGTVVLLTVLELLLPDGKMRKYMKGVFALLLLVVLISPLPKLFSSLGSIDEVEIASDRTIAHDSDFLNDYALETLSARERLSEAYLLANGYEADLEFLLHTDKSSIVGAKVFYDLSSCDFDSNIYMTNVGELLSSRLDIPTESIIFVEVGKDE